MIAICADAAAEVENPSPGKGWLSMLLFMVGGTFQCLRVQCFNSIAMGNFFLWFIKSSIRVAEEDRSMHTGD